MDSSDLEASVPGSAQFNRTAGEEADAAELARRAARQALESGRVYAQNAIDAAVRSLTAAKEQIGRAADQGTQYVAEQPGRSVAMAAAAGAIIGALFVLALRGRR